MPTRYNDAGLTKMAAAMSGDALRLSSPRLATNTLRTTAGQKSKTGQSASKSATDYLTLSTPCRFQSNLAIPRQMESAFFLRPLRLLRQHEVERQRQCYPNQHAAQEPSRSRALQTLHLLSFDSTTRNSDSFRPTLAAWLSDWLTYLLVEIWRSGSDLDWSVW